MSLSWDRTEHLDIQKEKAGWMFWARGNHENNSIKAEKPKSCSGDCELTILAEERSWETRPKASCESFE